MGKTVNIVILFEGRMEVKSIEISEESFLCCGKKCPFISYDIDEDKYHCNISNQSLKISNGYILRPPLCKTNEKIYNTFLEQLKLFTNKVNDIIKKE